MEREVVFHRILNAPIEKVYKAWTEPKEMAKWWGPHQFTAPLCELDVKKGGKIKIHMQGPDGNIYPMSGEYQEIIPNKRIDFLNYAEDREGNHLLEGTTLVLFEENGDKTNLTVQSKMTGLVDYADQMLNGMEAGWSQSLDKLNELVTK